MTEHNNQVPDVIERRYDETVAGIVTTLQWVIVALALAFIVRSFLVEAFRIPTGSMAETLSGSHYHICCDMCGFKYDLGGGDVANEKPKPKCLNCAYLIPQGTQLKVSNGDRIFVQKSIYQFTEPKRWDVVVFRYPKDPKENYIKRLVGLPGESLEIIDGDIYVDGLIQRKPEKVQDELWVQVYSSDHLPYIASEDYKASDSEAEFSWQLPFDNTENSKWDLGDLYEFSLDANDEQLHQVKFDSLNGERFTSQYAYNNTLNFCPQCRICSDLKIEFDVVFLDYGKSLAGAVLSKNGIGYLASVDMVGEMSIETIDGQKLKAGKVTIWPEVPLHISFANIDHLLVLEVNGERLEYDLGRGRNDAGEVSDDNIPEVGIVGAGKLDVSHVSLYRDIHYNDGVSARPGRPFELDKDEFFMCGDNSADSFDSRLWVGQGEGNMEFDDNGQKIQKLYKPGIVPREYLIGKAFFLYWGDAFEPYDGMLPVIPNFSEMKRIYGGQ